jgi:hypothetical protein
LAGTGKSTIARTIARKYFQKQYLGASFFFSRGGGDTGNAIKFVTTIVKQLATNVPSLKQHICDAIRVRPNITSDSLHDQWQHLVLSPLSKLSENRGQGTYVLIVDALDECDNNGNIDIIIKLLGEARTLNTARLRIFLTSRPEIPIRNGFIQIPDAEHQNFVLHHISPSIVDRDIAVFFEHHFKLIGQENDLDTSWPGKEVIQQLIEAAGGLFIWAATACRFIREGLFVDERVQFLLEGSTSTTTPEEHLNKLYITVLKKSIRPDYTIGEKEALYMLLRYILGSIVILYSPLSASSLDKLLGVPKQRMKQALKDFHAILDIPNADIHPLRLHRPSFRDFLLNNERCRDLNFWVHEKQIHKRLADCCIKLMSTSLRKDICGVNAPNKFAAEAERSWIELSLPPEVQYACRYWINHIRKSSAQLCDNGEVHLFLQKHLLHWMEALGWLGKISEGVHAITALESFVSVRISPE